MLDFAASLIHFASKSVDHLEHSGIPLCGKCFELDLGGDNDLRREQTKVATAQAEGTKTGKGWVEVLGRISPVLDKTVPGYRAARGQVQELAKQWQLAGAAGAGWGGKLLALAGGPVGVAVAGLTGLVTWLVKVNQEFNTAKEAAKEAWDAINKGPSELDKLEKAHGEAADEAERLKEQHRLLIDQAKDFETAADRKVKATLAQMEAQRSYQRALIDSREASGELTAEEAARMKGELKVGEMNQEAAVKLQAAQEKLAAVEEARRKGVDAVQQARESLRGEQDVERIEKELESARRAEKTATRLGSDARQTKWSDMMPSTESLENYANLIPAVALVNAAATQAARMEQDALAKAHQEEAEKQRKIAEEKEKELEAAKALREQREAALKDAESTLAQLRKMESDVIHEVREATQNQQLNEQYNLPRLAVENAQAIDQARQKDEQRAQAELLKAEQEKVKQLEREKSDAERQRDTEEGVVQRRAKEIATGLDKKLTQASGANDPNGLLPQLERVRDKIDDGTDAGELKGVIDELNASADRNHYLVRDTVSMLTNLAHYARNSEQRMARLEADLQRAKTDLANVQNHTKGMRR